MATTSRSRPPQPNAADVRRIQDEEAYPYRITTEIGKGSFATVFKGYHSQSRKAVAIKTISRSILTHKLLDNLESEIAILKALNNKHITELRDIVKAPRNIYLIMEYCSGGDLSHYIRHRGKVEGLQYIPHPGAAPQYWPHPKSGGLDPVVVKSFLGQLAQALKFLRDRNLIHRDIKPQNLLLEPSTPADAPIPIGIPLLKIADFGFARSLPNAALAETLCGSPLYMAPEILRYEKYDAKADLWSVGAVVYEMSVGKPPFRAQNHVELLKKIEHARGRVNFPDEVAAARDARGERGRESERDKEVTVVPPEIKALIRMLLKRKPIERASFEEFFASEAVKGEFEAVAAVANGTAVVGTANELVVEVPIPAPSSSTSTSSRNRRDKPESPLEGTPYDPKLYTLQTTMRFRRSGDRDERNDPVAGPSTPPHSRQPSDPIPPLAVGPAPTKVLAPLNGEPSLLAYPTKPKDAGVARGAESLNGSTRKDKEYVLVDDTRAVEFDRVIDEIDAARKRPPVTPRTTSTGSRGAAAAAALTKQMGRLVIGATVGNRGDHGNHNGHTNNPTANGVSSPSPSPSSANAQPPFPHGHEQNVIPPTPTTPASGGAPPPPFAATRRTPPHLQLTQQPQHQPSSSPDTLPTPSATPSSVATNHPPTPTPQPASTPIPIPMTFPPPPQQQQSYPNNSSPASAGGVFAYQQHQQPNALVRAINLASKALFGSPTHPGMGMAGGSGSPQSVTGMPRAGREGSGSGSAGGGSPSSALPSPAPSTMEHARSAGDNTVRVAVEKDKDGRSVKRAAAEDAVLRVVEDIAQKAQVLRDFADRKFARVESASGVGLSKPLPERRKSEVSAISPFNTVERDQQQRAKKEMDAEQNAVQAVALYIAVMAFSQKGINTLNKYCQEHIENASKSDNGDWTPGIDDALAWLREMFKTCVERSEIMKGWLPEGHQSPPMWIDRVIYDYALILMRQAASKELLEENYAQIEREYERALWMLYAIADDVIQEGNPYSDQDVKTISGFIDNTKTRLMRLRRRMEMRRAAAAEMKSGVPVAGYPVGTPA